MRRMGRAWRGPSGRHVCIGGMAAWRHVSLALLLPFLRPAGYAYALAALMPLHVHACMQVAVEVRLTLHMHTAHCTLHTATCDLHFLICLASAMCLLCPYVQPSLTDLLATDKATLAIEQAGRDAGRDLGREGEEEEPLAVMDRPSVHPCVSTSWVLVSYVPIYLMPYYCSRITCPSAVWFP
jgi:hypothetical protein